MQSLKRFVCSKCGKELSNRHSLSRHKKTCQSTSRNHVLDDSYNVVEPKSYRDTTAAKRTIESYYEPKPKKNPKIQTLLDDIINDDSDRPQAAHKGCSIVPPPTTLSPTIVYSPIKKPPQLPINVIPPHPSRTSKKILPPKRVLSTKKSLSHLRTKADIVGYSIDENDSSTDSIDITDIKPPTIKFLPATVE